MNTIPPAAYIMAGGDFLELFYSVEKCGKACGKVSVSKQGLYYRFHCRCTLDREDIYRLVLSCNQVQENLGILIPEGGSFALISRVSCKRIPKGDWHFFILPKARNQEEHFIPISPEEPFGYISRLRESFLVLQNGQPGILVSQKQE